MNFSKYHALGNDYIVIDPQDAPDGLSPEQVRLICHRNFGVGSDGILYGPKNDPGTGLGLQIFNPDGSEAEKSGNGLRIFSRYLWDRGLVHEDPFQITTLGGIVQSEVHEGGHEVTVEMGTVSFDSSIIPVQGDRREVLEENVDVDGETQVFSAATIGNPHCVLIRDDVTEAETCRLGPRLETHPLFPNRTNVQFMKILDRSNIQIEIWERGAGYTLASGSSSSAAAAVAHRLGRCDHEITVHMPGGRLQISLDDQFGVTMKGPVTRIAAGVLASDFFTEESSPLP
jgi:diaminopimelate epimerase